MTMPFEFGPNRALPAARVVKAAGPVCEGRTISLAATRHAPGSAIP